MSMPIRHWIRSANFAIEGVLHAASTQRHLRYHFYAAAAVLVFGYVVGVSKIEFLVIALAMIAVLAAEMLNTSVEYMVDILCPERRDEARAAKDVAAGAVLIAAFGAAVIGYIVLFPYVVQIFHRGVRVTKHPADEIAVVALIIVTIFVILLKAYFGKGHPLSGGMPSGHAALGFSVWVSVSFATRSAIASVLCFTLALLVAKSRINAGVHRPLEVAFGAAVGAGLTLALFLIFT